MSQQQTRYYQDEAEAAILDFWSKNGGNPLVDMATGTGKSVVIARLVKRLMTDYPTTRILMLVHVKELVQQNAQALVRAWPQAPIGINSAGLGRRDWRTPILYANIQSVFRKPDLLGERNLVIVDEAQLIPPEGDGMYLKLFQAMLDRDPDMRVAGFTATPYRTGSGRLDHGPMKLFDETVYSYGIGQAVADGFLVPLISKATVTGIDVSNVARRGGEFVEGALAEAADKHAITEGAADEIVSYGTNRRAWLVFCAGVEHAHHVRDALRSRQISCDTVTGETPPAERDRIIAAFRAGRIRALTNANVLCLDSKTEILTLNGWVAMNAMTEDHQVASWKEDGSIIFATPSRVVRRKLMPHERMVSLLGQNNNIRVTGNHRMIVKSRYGQWQKLSASEIAGKQVFMPVSGVAEPLKIEIPHQKMSDKERASRVRSLSYVYRKRGMSAEVARCEAEKHVLRRSAMRFKNPDELSLDDCSFIGFWQGDGTLSPRCEFSQSKAYPKIIEWFDDLLDRLGFAHSKIEKEATSKLPLGYSRWSIARGTGGSDQFREKGYFALEPYLKKTGTDLYWGLNKQQFAAFLEGFWLADGNHGQGDGNSARGTYVAGTQHHLYELLQAIGACRGYRFTLTPCSAAKNERHNQQWVLSWRETSVIQLLRETLSVEPQYIEEDTWCVTSATGNIVTRRNGKVVIMGNTTGFDAPICDMIAFLRPTLSTVLYVQMLGRGTRCIGADVRASIAAGKSNCLVLDFAGNVRRHGPVDQIVVRGKDKGRDETTVKVGSVRAKECPDCNTLIGIGIYVCDVCGHHWQAPVEAPKHEATADGELAVMSDGQFKNPWEPVSMMTLSRHTKRFDPEKPPTMRVDYSRGLTTTSEYVCFEHPAKSFPRIKAAKWWQSMHGQEPVPETVDEAIARGEGGEIATPSDIVTRQRENFVDIIGRRFTDQEVIRAANVGRVAYAGDRTRRREQRSWNADDDAIPF